MVVPSKKNTAGCIPSPCPRNTQGFMIFRMELTALSYITRITNLCVFLFTPQMLFTGCEKTHVMFTQRSGEVEGCTSSTCCYCSRLNEHRKEKFVLLALLLSAQSIKDCTRGNIHLPSLSGFNITACVSFTQGCETKKQKWMNPSVLGSSCNFL